MPKPRSGTMRLLGCWKPLRHEVRRMSLKDRPMDHLGERRMRGWAYMDLASTSESCVSRCEILGLLTADAQRSAPRPMIKRT